MEAVRAPERAALNIKSNRCTTVIRAISIGPGARYGRESGAAGKSSYQ